jgi:hypothetical protein
MNYFISWLAVRISYDTLFMPASLHSLILRSSICFTLPSKVLRKSYFAFSNGVSGLMNARSALGGIISSSITLSTTTSAPRGLIRKIETFNLHIFHFLLISSFLIKYYIFIYYYHSMMDIESKKILTK